MSYTAEKALTDSIRPRSVIGSFENLDVTRLRNPSEAHAKCTIVITDEVLRPHTKGSSFPQRYVPSKRQWDFVSRRRRSPCESAVR